MILANLPAWQRSSCFRVKTITWHLCYCD